MANTTWNPADKSAGITLSGGNLTALNTSGATCGVRAVHSQTNGKYYVEYTWTTSTNTQSCVGLVRAAYPLISFGDPASGVSGNCTVPRTGRIIVDGGTVGTPNIGTIASGTVVCVAVDLTARLIWFRPGAAGLWNASGTANPATAIGGIAIPNLGAGIAAYPAAGVSATNDQVVANFGDSAFTGAVPAGFISGFPTVAPSSTTQARAMILA